MKTKAIKAGAGYGIYCIHLFGIGTDRAMYRGVYDFSARQSYTGNFPWISMGGGFNGLPNQPYIARDIYAIGTDNAMYFSEFEFGGREDWGPWINIGGTFNSAPDSVDAFFDSGEKVAIVALGTDNQPWLKIRRVDWPSLSVEWLPSPSEWLPLGGKLIFEPVFAKPTVYFSVWPVIATTSVSLFNLFGIGMDRQMYEMTIESNYWPPVMSEWQPIGGCFSSAPSVTKWSENRIDICGLSSDNHLYHRAKENGIWIGDWEDLGGEFDSQPEVVSTGENRLDIFGLGTDDQMYHKAWDGNKWLPSLTDWEPLGGIFNSSPSISAYGSLAYSYPKYQMDVFALGTDDQLYHKYWDGFHWLPSQLNWKLLGGKFINPPLAPINQFPSQLDFNFPITVDGAPLGGNLHVTLFMNGRTTFSFHVHDSGFLSYACSICGVVIDGNNRAYTFAHYGHTWGTDFAGSRDFIWNETTPVNITLRDNWSDLFPCGGAKFGSRFDWDTLPPGGLSDTLPGLLKDMGGNAQLSVITLVS